MLDYIHVIDLAHDVESKLNGLGQALSMHGDRECDDLTSMLSTVAYEQASVVHTILKLMERAHSDSAPASQAD